jgi:hypothetical protein
MWIDVTVQNSSYDNLIFGTYRIHQLSFGASVFINFIFSLHVTSRYVVPLPPPPPL